MPMLQEIPRKILLVVCITGGLLLVTNKIFFFYPGRLEHISAVFTYPFLALSYTIANPIKEYFAKKQAYAALLKAYHESQLQNRHLYEENIKLLGATHFNEKTKTLRQFQDRYNLAQGVVAKIMMKHFADDSQHMIINKGTQDGIKEDMIALSHLQIIGRVTQVYPYHSTLLLISDSHCKVSAYTTKNDGQGIVVGKNDTNRLELAYVSHLCKIENEELVLSSGNGLVFPEGYALGKITAHETQDVCHRIEITPLVDLRELEYCLLIDRSKVKSF